jgi:hypothetical protein
MTEGGSRRERKGCKERRNGRQDTEDGSQTQETGGRKLKQEMEDGKRSWDKGKGICIKEKGEGGEWGGGKGGKCKGRQTGREVEIERGGRGFWFCDLNARMLVYKDQFK